jgi:hypothetical protein
MLMVNLPIGSPRLYRADTGTFSGGSRSPVQTVPFTKVNRCLAEGRVRLRELTAERAA